MCNYPALGMLMFKLCYHFLPEYVDVSNGLEYRSVSQLWIVFILYNLFVIWMVGVSISKRIRIGEFAEKALYAVLLISSPVMFSLERGNQINLAFAFTIFFFAFYDDENKILRELAYIMLALAASLKIYPAICGIILLKKENWKTILRVVVYGIGCFIIPFTYYGMDSLLKFVSFLLKFSDSSTLRYGYNYAIKNICMLISSEFSVPFSEGIYNFIYCSLIVLLFIAFFALKEEWMQWLCIVMLLLWIPTVSDQYMILFMIIPFISFMNWAFDSIKDIQRGGKTWREVIIPAVLFACILIPWALPIIEKYSTVNYYMTYTYILYFIDVILMAIYIIYMGMKNVILYLKSVNVRV